MRSEGYLRQAARFDGNSLENVVGERVHDAHRFRADSRVGMDLLEDFVDREGFLAMATTLLVRRCGLVRFAAGFLFAFLACYAFRGSNFFVHSGIGPYVDRNVALLLRT